MTRSLKISEEAGIIGSEKDVTSIAHSSRKKGQVMEDKMNKLTIEIVGRMYQDWDNEVFSWDIDNPIKIFLDETLLLSKSFKDFSILEESNDTETVTNIINELSYYKISKLQTCRVETESGESVRLPYAVCNIKSTGETVVKYGKWHLKAEI